MKTLLIFVLLIFVLLMVELLMVALLMEVLFGFVGFLRLKSKVFISSSTIVVG